MIQLYKKYNNSLLVFAIYLLIAAFALICSFDII